MASKSKAGTLLRYEAEHPGTLGPGVFLAVADLLDWLEEVARPAVIAAMVARANPPEAAAIALEDAYKRFQKEVADGDAGAGDASS